MPASSGLSTAPAARDDRAHPFSVCNDETRFHLNGLAATELRPCSERSRPAIGVERSGRESANALIDISSVGPDVIRRTQMQAVTALRGTPHHPGDPIRILGTPPGGSAARRARRSRRLDRGSGRLASSRASARSRSGSAHVRCGAPRCVVHALHRLDARKP
jgi:hypothetical protein